VIAIGQLAVVLKEIALARADLGVVADLLDVLAIDVAEGDEVTIPRRRPRIPLAHAPIADAADARPLVGRLRLIGHRPPARESVWQQDPPGRGSGRASQKVASGRGLACAHDHLQESLALSDPLRSAPILAQRRTTGEKGDRFSAGAPG